MVKGETVSFADLRKAAPAERRRLIARLADFGQTGAINLGKAIPLAGGVIGGAFDGTTTYAIGRVARNVFVTGGQASDAEQAEVKDLVESYSDLLFVEDDGKYDEFFWGTPREPRDRSSFRN